MENVHTPTLQPKPQQTTTEMYKSRKKISHFKKLSELCLKSWTIDRFNAHMRTGRFSAITYMVAYVYIQSV